MYEYIHTQPVKPTMPPRLLAKRLLPLCLFLHSDKTYRIKTPHFNFASSCMYKYNMLWVTYNKFKAHNLQAPRDIPRKLGKTLNVVMLGCENSDKTRIL